MPPEQMPDKNTREISKTRILLSVLCGALAFGIGGYPWGVDQFGEGSSLLILASVFFLVAGYWGCVLGLLTGNLRNIGRLAGAGLFAGIICFFVANIGGFILIATIGWLLIITPPVFLVLMVYFFRKGEKQIALAFFMLLLYTAVDWTIITGINPFSTRNVIFSLHAFDYAVTGLITGGCYGWVMGRTKTLAISGLIGFSLGSYWISIFYHLFESTNYAVYGFVVTYVLVSVTAGAFLVAGLFWSDAGTEKQDRIQPAQAIPEGLVHPEIVR